MGQNCCTIVLAREGLLALDMLDVLDVLGVVSTEKKGSQRKSKLMDAFVR